MPAAPSPAPRWHARAGAIILPIAILAIIAGVIGANGPIRALLADAFSRLSPAPVLAVLPVQALAIWLCSVALYLLRPGVTPAAAFESRILRDAGNNMLLILPGLGEAIGARALVLAGARPRAAAVVRGLDILAETLGQIPYMVVAFIVLSSVWSRVGLPKPTTPSPALLLLALPLLAGVLWLRGPGRRHPLVRRIRIEARLLLREAKRRHGAMPAAIALHAVAWGLSGVQIWLAARLMGLPLTFWHGIAMESAASTLRVVMFMVPGGLATQEAGVIGAGLVFGVAPADALALALVLRLRDIAFGLALLWWPVIELRARRTSPSA